MASSKAYLAYILDQLSELNGISVRAMMGEYIIYYRDKVVGGIYDDRFLVKSVKAAAARMPDADKFYKGQDELSWYDEDARIFLVRDHGWECIDGRDSYCDDCPAKQYCGAWEDVGDDDY